ncbi:hypothetical protein GCM10010360_65000 [Streptomyces nogalater]
MSLVDPVPSLLLAALSGAVCWEGTRNRVRERMHAGMADLMAARERALRG